MRGEKTYVSVSGSSFTRENFSAAKCGKEMLAFQEAALYEKTLVLQNVEKK